MDGPYYSQRQGHPIIRDKEDISKNFWAAFRAYINELSHLDYLCEHFHDECVDGYPMGCAANKIHGRLMQELGDVEWPLPNEKPDKEVIFDYIEFFHRFISKPIESWYHSWCGNNHPKEYDQKAAQNEYAERINQLFVNFRTVYKFEHGQVIREGSPILDTEVRSIELLSDDQHLQRLLNAAIGDFYDRSGQKKLQALRSLVDVFERLKTIESGDKKESASKVIQKLSPLQEMQALLASDMRALTEISNNFTIRHHEITKKELRDEDLIEYLFYLYYDFIRIILKKYAMLKPKSNSR